MRRYLIEVPHDESELACTRVVQTFLQTGSHYLTNADWGCEDGVHSAYLIVEAENKEQARWVVPPPLRTQAKVVGLTKFTLDEAGQIAVLPGH